MAFLSLPLVILSAAKNLNLSNPGRTYHLNNVAIVIYPFQRRAPFMKRDGSGDVCDVDPGCGGCGQPQCEQEC